MKQSILFCLLALLLVSCTTDKTYYLTTNNAAGLATGDKVYRQGLEIGEVTEVGFVGNEVQITIETNSALFAGQNFSINRDGDRRKLSFINHFLRPKN